MLPQVVLDLWLLLLNSLDISWWILRLCRHKRAVVLVPSLKRIVDTRKNTTWIISNSVRKTSSHLLILTVHRRLLRINGQRRSGNCTVYTRVQYHNPWRSLTSLSPIFSNSNCDNWSFVFQAVPDKFLEKKHINSRMERRRGRGITTFNWEPDDNCCSYSCFSGGVFPFRTRSSSKSLSCLIQLAASCSNKFRMMKLCNSCTDTSGRARLTYKTW